MPYRTTRRMVRRVLGRSLLACSLPLLVAACGRNGERPDVPMPAGMVRIPDGRFTMGAGSQVMAGDAAPHPVTVAAVYLDRTEVTNAAFAQFVQATHYQTTAEQPVDWAALQRELPPGTPKPPDEQLRPGSLVFQAPDHPVPLDDERAWWQWTVGADWRHPAGPTSDTTGLSQHPVVQVSYQDAAAYCAWAGKRMPTEAEWEFAARGGLEGKTFSWGDDPITPARANVWQGAFPLRNSGEDGHVGTAPVGSYPPNGYGLVDMAGNVWEWTADRFDPTALDPSAPPGPEERVIRGGSFMCHASYCAGYRTAARMHATPATSLMNTGFRCAADVRRPVVRGGPR